MTTLSDNWVQTAESLHRAVQVIGRFRKVDTTPDHVSYNHLTLEAYPEGVRTPYRERFGQISLSFLKGDVIYRSHEVAAPQMFPLHAHSPSTLAEALHLAIQDAGHQAMQLDGDILQDDEPFSYDVADAKAYTKILHEADTILKRIADATDATKTAVVLYPHHFDLSYLTFANEADSEESPHLNLGFAPFSDGIDRPYFYSYAYPVPDGYKELDLKMDWADDWEGGILFYDDTTAEEAENALKDYVEQALPLLRA